VTSVDVLDRSLAVAMFRLDSSLGSFISMASQRELITLWQFTSLYVAVNRSETSVQPAEQATACSEPLV
jgi:hypothetical protein